MMHIEPEKTIAHTVSRFKLSPPFSERRLLLFIGDAFSMSLAGLIAIWVQSLL